MKVEWRVSSPSDLEEKPIEIWDDITEKHIFFELFGKCMCITIKGVSEIDLFLHSVSLLIVMLGNNKTCNTA